jgi:membrane protease YdiL (CAAX protease family)
MLCPGCGYQYRPEVTRCADCGLDLVEEPPPSAFEKDEDDEAVSSLDAVSRPAPADAGDRMRRWELVLVLSVACGLSVISSTWYFLTGTVHPRSAISLFEGIVQELIDLAVLAYVLARRNRSFRDLGLSWRPADGAAAILLVVAAFLAELAARRMLYDVSILATGHAVATSRHYSQHIVGPAAAVLNVLYALINPVEEEMIVRAYAMTEIEALTGSIGLAIATSAGLQTFYHLYQGLPNALAHGAAFLVFSCFYARFRRIGPLIAAHAFWDLVLTIHLL